MSHNYHNLKREEDALMKKIWMLVVIAILLFFAAALFTMGTLDWIDAKNNTAPAQTSRDCESKSLENRLQPKFYLLQ